MELSGHQERRGLLVSREVPASRALLEPRETLALRDLKGARAYKDPEESPASPACLGSPA